VVVNALTERHGGTITWTSPSGLKGGQARPHAHAHAHAHARTHTYAQASYSNADRHFNGPYELVEGKYSLCTSTAYPVPYCYGTGHHY
jgi:hypothetical protein